MPKQFLWVKKDAIFTPTTAVQKELAKLLRNRQVRQEIHEAYAKRVEKYVPLDTGALRESVEVSPDWVRWGNGTGVDGRGRPVDVWKYAHYVNEGIIYGPNYPIRVKYDSTGNWEVVGFWSPKDKKKFPTGRPLTYYTPGTGPHWEIKVMENYVDKIGFQREATQILKRHSKKG